MNELGGFRNSFTVALTGLDVDEKAAFAEAAFWDACPYGPDDFGFIENKVVHTNKPDPATQEEATAIWRVTVKDPDERKVGRAFTDAMVHTVLAGIPGMYGLGGGPEAASRSGCTGRRRCLPTWSRSTSTSTAPPPRSTRSFRPSLTLVPRAQVSGNHDRSRRARRADGRGTVGIFVGTRSGDKGGDANLGVYARTDAGWAWLDAELTVERLKQLLPETAALAVDRYRFPNLRSLNFVVRGLLQEGVAASTRQDAQAKALGSGCASVS